MNADTVPSFIFSHMQNPSLSQGFATSLDSKMYEGEPLSLLHPCLLHKQGAELKCVR